MASFKEGPSKNNNVEGLDGMTQEGPDGAFLAEIVHHTPSTLKPILQEAGVDFDDILTAEADTPKSS